MTTLPLIHLTLSLESMADRLGLLFSSAHKLTFRAYNTTKFYFAFSFNPQLLFKHKCSTNRSVFITIRVDLSKVHLLSTTNLLIYFIPRTIVDYCKKSLFRPLLYKSIRPLMIYSCNNTSSLFDTKPYTSNHWCECF
jgi:hypothetical protein